MKVLWIHWFKRTDKVDDFLLWTKKNLEREWIEMIAPDFEIWESIDYKNWEKKLDEIWVWDYDVVVWHSMWCRVAMEYLIEKQIKIKKLIIVAPAIKVSSKEVEEFYKKMKHDFSEIKNYVDEIIVLISNDDKVIRLEWAYDLASKVDAKLVEVNWYWHFNLLEVKLIEDLIKG